MNGLPPTELEEWYDAVRLWNNLLTGADSEYWVQLSPGTAVGEFSQIMVYITLNQLTHVPET